MRNRLIESGINSITRGISLAIIGIPLLLVFSVITVISTTVSSFWHDLVTVFVFIFFLGLLFGFVGLLFKAPVSAGFVLLRFHWKRITGQETEGTYGEKFYDYMENPNFVYSDEEFLSHGLRSLIWTLGVYFFATILSWSLLLLSLFFEFSLPHRLSELILTFVTWLTPLGLFTERFVVTSGAQFVLSFTLIPTAYFAAASLEHFSRYIEIRIQKAAIESPHIQSIISTIYSLQVDSIVEIIAGFRFLGYIALIPQKLKGYIHYISIIVYISYGTKIWRGLNWLRSLVGLAPLGPRSKRHYKRLIKHLTMLLVILPLFAVTFYILNFGTEFLTLLSLSLATISISLAISSYTEPDRWFPEDIRHIIMTSGPEDWQYRELHDTQESEYVYKDNRDIVLRFEPLNQTVEFHEPWVTNYHDETAYRRRLNILYDGQRYEKVYIIEVDGRKDRVPMPKSMRNTTITQFEYKIGQIVNCAPAPGLARDMEEYEREYEEALDIGGIKIEK